MNVFSRVYTVVVSLILVGIAGLLVWSAAQIDDQALEQLRIQQIQAAGVDSTIEYERLWTIDDLVVSDYFETEGSEFRYWGGIAEAPWDVGGTYPAEALSASYDTEKEVPDFYGLKWGTNDYYVNVDRGDESTVRDFLKTMDGMAASQIDTLILDFRFLRAIHFGSVLRLFNQIAPSQKIVMGKIVDAHQEEEIVSSGRPFFTANQTIFLVDERIPDPVKHLVTNLCQMREYNVRGTLGTVRDSVCLTTQFVINDHKYRVCTEKWTSASGGFDLPESYERVHDSVRIRSLGQVDVAWYKKRDTAAMDQLIRRLLVEL